MSVLDQRFKVKVTLEIETADGQPFYKNEAVYANMGYGSMYDVEKAMYSSLGRLLEMGEPQAIAALVKSQVAAK